MFRRTKKLSTSPTGFGLTRALTRVRVDRVDHGLDLNKSAVFDVELGEVAGRGIDAVCATAGDLLGVAIATSVATMASLLGPLQAHPKFFARSSRQQN